MNAATRATDARTTPVRPALKVYEEPGRARNEIVEAHLPAVRAAVRKHTGSDDDDFYQSGVIGLMRAADEWLASPGLAGRYPLATFVAIKVRYAVLVAYHKAGVRAYREAATGHDGAGEAGASDHAGGLADEALGALDGRPELREAVERTYGLDGGGSRSTREVAVEMRISHQTVAKYLREALEIMRGVF